MKQLLTISFVVTIFAISMVVTVAAQNTNDNAVSEKTREQARLMVTSQGATVRHLQLELALQKQQMIGERVIQKIGEIDDSIDTTDLEVILEELELLADDVSSADPTADTEDVVQDFVDFKEDALRLSQEFKEKVSNSLTEQEKNQVRQGLMDNLEANLTRLRERVKSAIREHNAERIQNAVRAMGATDSDDISGQARKGEADSNQIVEKLREQVKEMTSEQKRQAAQEIKRIAEQNRVRSQAAVEAAKEQLQERLRDRVQERLDSISKTRGLNASYVAQRINQSIGPVDSGNSSQGGSA
jgi:predicted ATP-dependent endonuclease of OLD family